MITFFICSKVFFRSLSPIYPSYSMNVYCWFLFITWSVFVVFALCATLAPECAHRVHTWFLWRFFVLSRKTFLVTAVVDVINIFRSNDLVSSSLMTFFFPLNLMKKNGITIICASAFFSFVVVVFHWLLSNCGNMIILNLFHQKSKHPERIRNVLCDRFHDIVDFKMLFFALEMFYAHAPCTWMEKGWLW